LRVVKQAPAHAQLASQPAVFAGLDGMATTATALFRMALDAWAAQDPALAHDLVRRNTAMDDDYLTLLDRILALQGTDAVAIAVAAILVGRALERIADHTVIVGERLQYLLTGDPAYLAAEVR
jgi:phosphate transport system protein